MPTLRAVPVQLAASERKTLKKRARGDPMDVVRSDVPVWLSVGDRG
jgi:hypothetical protein